MNSKAKWNDTGEFFVDALGRDVLNYLQRYDDGSTKTRVNEEYIITEKDGTQRN